jgi:hypothetical protein
MSLYFQTCLVSFFLFLSPGTTNGLVCFLPFTTPPPPVSCGGSACWTSMEQPMWTSPSTISQVSVNSSAKFIVRHIHSEPWRTFKTLILKTSSSSKQDLKASVFDTCCTYLSIVVHASFCRNYWNTYLSYLFMNYPCYQD